MAYLRDITRKCLTCGKAAAVVLVNYRNAEQGYYCKTHGNAAEKALQKREIESEQE